MTDWPSFKLQLEGTINLYVSSRPEGHLDKEMQMMLGILLTLYGTTDLWLFLGNNPNEIREVIWEKTRLRRTWQSSKAPADKTNLNNATQQLIPEIQKLKN